jgi:hypothetical protein
MTLEKFLEFAEFVRQYIAARNQIEAAKDAQVAQLSARVAELEAQLADTLSKLAIALSNDAADADAIAKANADAKAATEAVFKTQEELSSAKLQLEQVIQDQAKIDADLVDAIAKLQSEFIPV